MKFYIKQLDRGHHAGKFVALTIPTGDKISSRPFDDANVCRWHAERSGYFFATDHGNLANDLDDYLIAE